MQDAVSFNEVQLPVDQLGECAKDLALFTYAVNHGLSEEAFADLLKLSSCDAKYRTPYLMRKFIEASVNVEKRQVDCCLNGCVAFTHTRSRLTSCDACGTARYTASGKPARQMTYWPLTAWLINMLSDPILGPDMMAGMKEARSAASRNSDGKQREGLHDWHDGLTFLEALRAGLFDEDTDIALSVSTDGFEAWRQRGFQGWPIIVTVLNLSPGVRTRNICQIVVAITPGPRQPVDLDSFLHPLVAELNQLARGIPDIRIAGSSQLRTVRAHVVQFTADMSAFDILLNITGYNGYSPSRSREFHGVYHAASNHHYFPPRDPTSGEILFSIEGCTVPRRSAERMQRDADEVEEARSIGRSLAFQKALSKKSGVKGHSLLFAPSNAMRQAYPHLSHLWRIGPAAAPYDAMHLLMQNVAPLLWKLFAGKVPVEGVANEDYVLSPATVAVIGREMVAARRTVPMAQARSLRNIDLQFRSFKAVDWMYWLVSTAQVQLVGRIPDVYFQMLMALCKACRVLFRPRGLSAPELTAVEARLKRFVHLYYTNVYRGTYERLPLCRSIIAAVLDLVPSMRASGPVWASWQFPAERKVGELGTLIHSHSNPSANRAGAVTRRIQAELITSFGETYALAEWAAATGKERRREGAPRGSVELPAGVSGQEWRWTVTLLPPRVLAAPLVGPELTAMRAALASEGVTDLPSTILAMKYFRLKLTNGTIAGSKPLGSDSAQHRRRNYLLRINSKVKRRRRDGRVVEVPVSTYGAVLHYALVHIDGRPLAFAYVAPVKSAQDRARRSGYPAQRFGIDCFLSADGVRYYAPAGAMDAVVGTLEREGVHFVLFDREPFSDER